MICPGCERSNRPAARFCNGCGASLAPRCPGCGASNEPGARFCDACGASLSGGAPAEKAIARKVVTVVFADLIGSVSLHERLDAESARRVVDRYHRTMTAAVEVHGGKVIQLLGDGVLAAFGVPRVAEDDAIRAVRAAAGMQRAFRELAREQGPPMEGVGLRVAVNTGEVVVSDDETAVMGDPTNVAARLQHEARDGDVLVGEGTQRLVGDLVTLAPLGAFALKGRSETVAAFRLVSLDRPASARTASFVGRDEELRRLVAVYEAAVAAPAARLAVLLGSPGLGKSRLVAEFTARATGRATVLTARCDAAGGTTFAPIAEALRAFLRIEEGAGGAVLRAAIDAVVPGQEAERARIATGIEALFSGAPSSPEETFFAVRRLLAALAVVRPVVLVIDDLHWAEPLLFDLVEHLVTWSAGVPLFLLVAARPELRDARSSLTTAGPLVADAITLGGLDAGSATRLAASAIGAGELPAALAGRVLATSEGNPLFLGELVRMLVQDGTLVREGDRWVTTVEVSKLDMPPTIHVLLAARIERLRPEERSVLERAAVVGRQFSRAAVAHLLGAAPDLDARLEALRRSELVEPDTGWFLGEPALRFHHVLIRDAAYRRVLKETRAELHERLADWVEERAGESAEHDETIGFHLEQAHQNRLDLGPLDARGNSLGERAARRLGAAGRRALARDDVSLAASLLGRAIACLDRDDPARADLALDWCEALLAAGEVSSAAPAVAELGRFAGASERLRAWHTCFVGQLAALTDPQSLRASADSAEAAAAVLAEAGDAAGEAKAHSVHAAALARLGEVGACEAALDRALAAARRVRDRRRQNAVLAGAPVAALWGPSPVTRASGRCLDVVRVLRITQGAPAVEAVALRCQAVLEALRGRGEAARRMIASSRRMVEELGIAAQILDADVFAGLIDLLEGDAEAAERSLRAAYEGLRERGLGIDAARAAALLGKALLAIGRAAEAEALSHESEELAGDDLKAAIAWRGVRAEALAQRGDAAEAVEFARAAVAIASGTDALLDHADARRALATALRAAGHSGEADAEERRALELWEAKGATLLVDRARATQSGALPDRPVADRADPPPAARRRVRENAATAGGRRLLAAAHSRDMDAIAALLADDLQVVHHPTGGLIDRAAGLERWRMLLAAEGLSISYENLATLGDSLALVRDVTAFDRLSQDGHAFGAARSIYRTLLDVNERGQAVRVEVFGDDRLGDAVARLYERYAERLPEGSEREGAAAIARSVAAIVSLTSSSTDRYREILAPNIEFEDHRRLVRVPPARGAVEWQQRVESWFETIEHSGYSVEEVLDLRPAGLVVRFIERGHDRAGGGSFEIPVLNSYLFDAEGRLARVELFDPDQESEALARFDAQAGATRAGAPRRVAPNFATEHARRLDAAMAARDPDALARLAAPGLEVVHHPTGATYGHGAAIERFRALFQDSDALSTRHEPLATLGPVHALLRAATSASGAVFGAFDAGSFETEYLAVLEADAEARSTRVEVFASDHLATAIARLYERHAELLPAGTERARAAARARGIADGLIPGEAHRAVSPDVEFVDHRLLGFGSSRGAETFRRAGRVQQELTSGLALRVDDVLALREEGFLVAWTTFGTNLDGGAFESHYLMLRVYDGGGLLRWTEWFDPDDAAAALARFEALAAAIPARRVHANAATAAAERVVAAIAARDETAYEALITEDIEILHHPTGAAYGRDGLLATWREVLRFDPRYEREVLAGLGESLALVRDLIAADSRGERGPGPAEWRNSLLYETDRDGRMGRGEVFADDRLGDALVRLYERYAELRPEGPERARAATVSRGVAAFLLQDIEAIAGVIAPEVEVADHRVLGFGSARGAEPYLRAMRSLEEAAQDRVASTDDVLAASPDALLVRRATGGIDRASGGSFEKRFLQLLRFGADGRVTHVELFEPERADTALARLDATPAEVRVARRVRRNAALDNAARTEAAISARDDTALEGLLAEDFEALNHVHGTVYDRTGPLLAWRALLQAEGVVFRNEPLAALGDALGLFRQISAIESLSGEGIDVGAAHFDYWLLLEVDARGGARRSEVFAPDRLGDAIARLYARHAERLPEGPEHVRAAAIARALAVLVGPLDLERWRTALAHDLEFVDRRRLGWGPGRGADAFLYGMRTLLDATAGSTTRIDDVLAAEPDAVLVRWTNFGTDRASGGEYERPFLMLAHFGPDGLLARWEMFDAEAIGAALERFDEITAGAPEPRFANAAWRAGVRQGERLMARDWNGMIAARAPGFRQEDRRALSRLDLAGDDVTANQRILFGLRTIRVENTLLATRGERLALRRICLRGEPREGGPVEYEMVDINEIDREGRLAAAVHFDPGDLDAAYAELDRRFAAGEGAPHARILATLAELARAWSARDGEALARVADESFAFTSHRLVRSGETLDRAAWIAGCRVLGEMGVEDDTRVDHLRVTPRAALRVGSWHGTREGGPFEAPIVFVNAHDGERLLSQEMYDAEQLDAALARFAELRAEYEARTRGAR